MQALSPWKCFFYYYTPRSKHLLITLTHDPIFPILNPPMTETLSQEKLRQMVSRWLPAGRSRPFRIYQDTTDFFRIEYGDVVVLGDHKNFMHGYSVKDVKGNLVRILDFVKGGPLYMK